MEESFQNYLASGEKESDAGYEIHIELPGYKKEDVKAELKDGNLTIMATTKTENDKKSEDGKYIRRERFCGNCSRSKCTMMKSCSIFTLHKSIGTVMNGKNF